MTAHRFEYSSFIETSVERLWDFHLSPGALEKLSPGWLGLRVTDGGQGVADGSLVRVEAGVWPLRRPWQALHTGVEINRCFTDIALESPFAFWVHQHRFERIGVNRSRLTDVVHFLPPAWIPDSVGVPLVRAALSLLFRWRHRQTRRAVSEPGFASGPHLEMAAPVS